MKAELAEDVAADCSVSDAEAIQSLHIAHDTPCVSTLPSPTTTIGICGRSLEAGRKASSASE